MKDETIHTETLLCFNKRNGQLTTTDDDRVTSSSFIHGSKHCIGHGYICKVGCRHVTKKITRKQIQEYLQTCPDSTVITEVYPTRFCCNKKCGAPSRHFLDFERKGHSTCTKCGRVQYLAPQKMGTLHLGDDEKANKSLWNITPGMNARDTVLKKNGKRLRIGSQRIKSHQRHYWTILSIIGNIAEKWNFLGLESIVNRSKYKCRQFYYGVHDETYNDNHFKMPHGRAQFAAACFYAAVLEFESNRKVETPATLPTIIESAQEEVHRSHYRKTRDVTAPVIIKYVQKLKTCGLCNVDIPEITADTLRFKSKNSSLEHARLAIFNKCERNTVNMSMNTTWGVEIGNTTKGVLYIDGVVGNGAAFRAGLQKGDYLFQFDGYTIEVDTTARVFGELVQKARAREDEFVKLIIMREKK